MFHNGFKIRLRAKADDTAEWCSEFTISDSFKEHFFLLFRKTKFTMKIKDALNDSFRRPLWP